MIVTDQRAVMTIYFCSAGIVLGVFLHFYNAARLEEASVDLFYIYILGIMICNIAALSIAWHYWVIISIFSKFISVLHVLFFFYMLFGIGVISYGNYIAISEN